MSRSGIDRWAKPLVLAVVLLAGWSGAAVWAQSESQSESGPWTAQQLQASAEMAAAIDRHIEDRLKAEGITRESRFC